MTNVFLMSCLLFILSCCWMIEFSHEESLTMLNRTGLIDGFDDESNSRVLSRKKRYLAFPEGSSFSVSYCGTFGAIGDPQYIYLSWAINWGVAYDLPNETWINNDQNFYKMPKPVMQRRNRRELYNRLERAIDNMGFPGKSCILRALCESPQYFGREKSNMVTELLRSIFSLPISKVLPFEHIDLKEYDLAHRKGRKNAFCMGEYPDCSFSLIELGLGEYSRPINYMR